MSRPNIVLIMTDQQRADLRKSEGYPLDTMPFLDEAARGGVAFARAYTPNPTCMPARVSVFTGRYPSCHRVRTNHNRADALYTRDLLDIVKSAGYRTALCGKNHSHRAPEDFDFHACCGHLGNEGEENDTPEQKAFARFLLDTNHMETHFPSPGGVEVQHPYRNVSDALRFIDMDADEKPFFLWLSFAEPHNPFQVPAPYYDMFPPESLPPARAEADVLPDKGARWVWLRGVWERVLGEDAPARILRARSNYLGMLRLIDDQLKRFMDGLTARGLDQNTLVIFVSDHGDFAGEYGLIRKGVDLPEALVRVPMAFWGAGVKKQARREDACVSLIDLLPTVCDLLEVPLPLGAQGRSLLPLLRGAETPPGEFSVAYAESGFSGLYWNDRDALSLPAEGATDDAFTRFDCLNTWTQCGQVRMARKGDWKIQVDMMGEVYLYNLKNDPCETRNLAGDARYVAVRADMLRELAAAMLRACDPLPYPRARYRVKRHPKGYWRDAGYVSPDPGVGA